MGDRRLVLIILRGGLDGLHALVPWGDPDYALMRQHLALSAPDQPGSTLQRLDQHFALPAELTFMAQAYGRGEVIALHAIASPYRERSHFDAQRLLETAGASLERQREGWLNRALQAMRPSDPKALAFAHAVPAVLQGAVPVGSYAPSRLPASGSDFFERVGRLYANDALLAPMWAQALSAQGMARANPRDDTQSAPAQAALVESAKLAARFLAPAEGARIAVLESEGWDTHVQQAPRLGNLLRQLDRALLTLAEGLGSAWSQTAVLVLTEFGRTVRPNGTAGTDHGTGAAAFLLGGAVAGGRVIADWPGLSASALHQGRDLMPTADLRSLLKAVAHDHLRLPMNRIDAEVFPDASQAAPLSDLFRA